jgi:hypothetical protein
MDGQREPLEPPDGDERQTSSMQVSGAADGGSSRMLLICLALLVCIGAAGAVAAVLSSSGGSQDGYIAGPGSSSGSQASHVAGTGSSPAATKIRSPKPTAIKTRTAQSAPRASHRAITGADVTSKGVTKSALRWPPQLQRQMLHWQEGPGGSALTTVETQMGNAMQTAGLKMYAPMKMACDSLASGIGAAQAGPPIPYEAMQRLYAKALAGLSRAAADCRAAISVHVDGEDAAIHLNHGLLYQSREEFATTSGKLYKATAEIQALSR